MKHHLTDDFDFKKGNMWTKTIYINFCDITIDQAGTLHLKLNKKTASLHLFWDVPH